MKSQPLESSIMLAGLTRGLWTGAPADRYPERPGTLANASGWPSRPVPDVEMPGVAGEDRATGPECRFGESTSCRRPWRCV